MNVSQLATTWRDIQAPATGDIRAELVQEAAEYLGLKVDDAWDRLRGAGERFAQEWSSTVGGATDAATLTRFYNHSDTELFELLEWHASDPIHFRTLVLRDVAVRHPGRTYLDYGSGIGSDAIAFATAGFDVTLADISDLLLRFAEFRCRRRGIRVQTIDLKAQSLPTNAYDVAVCFDVLEHIPKPMPVVRRIREALRPDGLLAIHAPFGVDPERPMHVVHRDIVTPRMRSLGFQRMDIDFPPPVVAPQVYRRVDLPLRDRVGYFVYDVYMNNSTGSQIADVYRRLFAGPPAARTF